MKLEAVLRNKQIGTVVACMFMWVLTGCGTVATVATDEDQVAQSAQEWLDALRSRDFDKALSYTSPAFRQITTMSSYSGRYAGVATWTDARVNKVTCEEDSCDVQIMATYQLGRPRIENTRAIDKVWIRLDGQWYLYER